MKSPCSSDYEDLIANSDYCFKIFENKLNWPSAKQKCQDEGANLVCFNDTYERDFWTTKCEGCWAGYAWESGWFSSGQWKADDSNATCPDDVVPGSGNLMDTSGQCSRILSSSPNKLEGGECTDDDEKFICQKKKQLTSILLNQDSELSLLELHK